MENESLTPPFLSPEIYDHIQGFVHLTQRKTGWLMFGGERGRLRFDELYSDSATRLIVHLRQQQIPRFLVKHVLREVCAQDIVHRPELEKLAAIRADLLIQYLKETASRIR